MRLSSRRELYKLRELAHFFMAGVTCCFCHKPLSTIAEDFVLHGNTTGPKLVDKISIHHLDGNHDNQARENKAPAHTSCHKAYHRRIANSLKQKEQEQHDWE